MLTRSFDSVQRHAQTLTGAKGQPIQRTIITGVSTSASSNSHLAKRNNDPNFSKPTHVSSGKPGKGSKSKPPQLTSAQKLKAKIEADKQLKKSSEDDTWWKSQLKELEAIDDIERRINKVDFILRGKRAETGWLAVEVSLYRLHLMILAWLADEQGESEPVCEKFTVRLLHSISELRVHSSLFPIAAQVLTQVLTALGFDSITPPVAKLQEDRELGFKFVKLIKSKSGKLLHPHLRIARSSSEFQLKAYGAFMDRSMDSTPDPRVKFDPDGWQHKVSAYAHRTNTCQTLCRCWTRLIAMSLCLWWHLRQREKRFHHSMLWKKSCVKVMMGLSYTSHRLRHCANKVSPTPHTHTIFL